MANTKLETEELQALRKKIFITGYKGGMAHLASCYSCLEMLYALYLKDILRYDLSNPKWKDRDRFILSTCGVSFIRSNAESRNDLGEDV